MRCIKCNEFIEDKYISDSDDNYEFMKLQYIYLCPCGHEGTIYLTVMAIN